MHLIRLGGLDKDRTRLTHRNPDISISAASDSGHSVHLPTRAALQERLMGAIGKAYTRTAGFLDTTPGNVMHL
jgi:hypothetical protein